MSISENDIKISGLRVYLDAAIELLEKECAEHLRLKKKYEMMDDVLVKVNDEVEKLDSMYTGNGDLWAGIGRIRILLDSIQTRPKVEGLNI